jgi:hypothetical protein
MGNTRSARRKLSLTGEKRFKLKPAIWARHHSRRDDWNKKHRLTDGVLNLAFPQRAGGNRLLVLPEAKGLRGAAEQAAQLALDAIAQRRERAMGVSIIFPRVAEEADKLWNFYQRSHKS